MGLKSDPLNSSLIYNSFHTSIMAKAMKAMKAMAAMKAMKAMKKKVVSAKLAKRHAFFGKLDKTATGLKKSDLVQTKSGKIVSKKKSLLARSHHGLLHARRPAKNSRSRGSQSSKRALHSTRRPRSSTASECIEQYSLSLRTK